MKKEELERRIDEAEKLDDLKAILKEFLPDSAEMAGRRHQWIEIPDTEARQKATLDVARNPKAAPGATVEFYKLSTGMVYTPDSPVSVPVNVVPDDGARGQIRFAIAVVNDAMRDSGISQVEGELVIMLPPSMVDGDPVIRLNSKKRTRDVRIRDEYLDLAKYEDFEIPYQVYFNEGKGAIKDKGESGRNHGYAESKSPPTMKIGP